jgi:hypothetical protein
MKTRINKLDAPASVIAERNEGEDASTKEKTASVEALPEVQK